MLENIKFKSDNNSGSVAAAYLILITGLVGITLASGLAFWRSPHVPIYVLSIGGGLVLLSLLLKLKPDLPSQALWLFSRGRGSSAAEYEPSIIKSAPTTFGTNRPPTVEEIRDLKDNPRNWVPSRSRGGRSSLRGESSLG